MKWGSKEHLDALRELRKLWPTPDGLCVRCLDLGESVPATHGELCDGCHVSAGEAQDRAAAEEMY